MDSLNNKKIDVKTYIKSIENFTDEVMSDRIDEGFARGLSLERVKQPIIITFLAGKTRIIDGNHRLYRNWCDKKSSIKVVEVPADILIDYSSPIGNLPKRALARWKGVIFGVST